MGVQNLQIIFDNPTAVYAPGQTVTGRVLIVVNDSVKIRSTYRARQRWRLHVCVRIAFYALSRALGVKLKFKGEAKNSWTEQESRRNDNGETENYSVKYDAEDEYFENKSTLVGGGSEWKSFLLKFCSTLVQSYGFIMNTIDNVDRCLSTSVSQICVNRFR